MRKVITLLLAAGLVFSVVNNASAVEVKASGTVDFAFDYTTNRTNPFMSTSDMVNNFGTEGAKHNKHMGAVQRLRLGFDFIASENLSAHYNAQIGTFTWGGPATGIQPGTGGNDNENLGGALGSRAANIVTRFAYLDWMLPNTDVKIRMGMQPMTTPSYTSASPVLDRNVTGILISAPVTENIALSGGWVRAESSPRRGAWAEQPSNEHFNDVFDLFNLVANFKYDGFQLTPWLLMGPRGSDATGAPGLPNGLSPLWINDKLEDGTGSALAQPDKKGDSFVWFAGLGGELTMFDPFRLTGDFYYAQNKTKHSYSSRSGWYAALGAEYKTQYGTPTLKAWYSTGDDAKASNGSERAPYLVGRFNATNTFFDGAYSIGNSFARPSPTGTWGLGLYWNGLSFIENLTHNFGVVYIAGTNAPENIYLYANGAQSPLHYMTKKDSLIEFDFTSIYDIYQNLTAVLELSYIVQNFNGDVWGRDFNIIDADGNGKKAQFSNVFRGTVNLRYKF